MRNFELASCNLCGLPGASLVVVSTCEQLTRKLRQFYVLCMCPVAEYFGTAEEAAEAWNNANASGKRIRQHRKRSTDHSPERAHARRLLNLVDRALSITGAEMGNLQLYDPDWGALRIKAQRGFHKPFLEFFDQVHVGEAACGAALKQARQIVVEDVTDSPMFHRTAALGVLLDAGVRSVQSTPFLDQSGSVIGVLSTHWRKPRRMDPYQLQPLSAIARSIVQLVGRTRILVQRHPDRNLLIDTLPTDPPVLK